MQLSNLISDSASTIVDLLKKLPEIGEGFATFLAAIVVVIGWLVARRWDMRKHQIENAHAHLISHKETVRDQGPIIGSYTAKLNPFPKYPALLTPNKKKLLKSILLTLNEFEILSIDIAHGLANEAYAIAAERGLLCTFFLISRDFIESCREKRNQRAFSRNFERQFVRIYIKRWSVVEFLLESALGRPMPRYSYFVFKVRYAIFSRIYGLDTDLRRENWEKIRDRSRDFRQVVGMIVVTLLTIFCLWSYKQLFV